MADESKDQDQRKNVESAGSTGSSSRPENDIDILAKRLYDAPGDLTNRVVGTLLHVDLGQKFAQPINSALATQYLKGRSILEQRQHQGKKADDLSGLSGEDETAVKVYQKVHSDLPAKIPFVDRDALIREVERNIEIKANLIGPHHGNDPAPDHEKGPSSIPSPGQPVHGRTPPPPNYSGAKSPGTSGPKVPLPRTSGTAAAKDPSPKSIGTAASKEVTGKGAYQRPIGSSASARKSGEASEKGLTTKEATGSGLTDRQNKTAKQSQNTQAQAEKGASAQLPPRPHEPEARQLKSHETAGSDGARTEVVVPPPHPITRLETRVGHPGSNTANKETLAGTAATRYVPIRFAQILAPEKTAAQQLHLHSQFFVTRGTAQSARTLALIEGRQVTSASADNRRLMPATAHWTGVVARMLVIFERHVQQNKNDLSAPRLEPGPHDRSVKSIKAADAMILQVVTRMQGFPFGRQFGLVERIFPLLPAEGFLQRSLMQRSTRYSTRTDNLALLGEQARGSFAKDLGADLKANRADKTNTTGNVIGTGKSHSEGARQASEQGQRQAETRSSGQARGSGEAHGTSADHKTAKAQNKADHHLSGEVHNASQPHHSPEAHSAEKSYNQTETNRPETSRATNARPIRVVDTKGAEVSPFAKDHDDVEACEGPGGGAVKTYVVKGLMPDKRYITGGELAFVAIMALASASRVRPGEDAAQRGLTQARREFVLVEEEPWISADYELPSSNGIKSKDRLEQSTTNNAKPQDTRAPLTEASPSRAQAPRAQPQQKILLRPQIMVQEGDNLSVMAEALFNDSRLGHLIADLNAKTIDESYSGEARIIRLTTRQRLSLPVYQDVMQYSAGQLGQVGDRPLITIVESTAIDRELLNEGLSPMLGINSKNRDPLDAD